MLRFLAVVALVATGVSGAQVGANPIRRIVNLLQAMQEKVKEEGKAEEKLYHKFYCFCENGAASLQKELSEGDAAAKQLSADVEAKSARKAQLDEEVAQHRKDRADAQDALKQATEIRAKEKEEFEAATADFRTNVAALEKAISVLGKGMGQAFLQSRASMAGLKRAVEAGSGVSDMEKQEVISLLSGKSPYGDYQASSGEIVGILKAMLDEMKKDLGTTLTTEEESAKNFRELEAAKKDEIEAATRGIEAKVVQSGELAVEVTEDKNAAANTLKEMEANREFLANLGESCKTKKAEYEERVKERGQELLAIAEAVKVLNDDDALDIFKKTLPSPKAVGAVSLLQEAPSAQDQAFAYVQQAADASQTRSPALNLIAMQLRSGAVDFGKVLKMIDDMVAHLGAEQKDDDDQLSFCKDEFNKAGDNKKTLERDIGDLSANIDALGERMKQLEGEIAQLKESIATTEKAMEDATAQRKEENTEFTSTKAMNTAAKQLVEKAKNRLNKFYNPALYKPPPQRELTEEERIAQNMGEVLPTEAPKYIAGTKIVALQSRKDPGAPPATWEGGYKKSESSGGVIGLMDMILKDLDMQMQQNDLDEETAQKDYEKLMEEAKAAVAKDSESLTGNEGALAEANEDHEQAKADRQSKNGELMEENKNIANLHKACDFLMENYDFRKEARTNEAEALKNAKAVLSGANFE